MFVSERDDRGGWGASISKIGDICPYCDGKLIGENIESKQYNIDLSIGEKEIILFRKKNREKMVECGRLCFRCRKVDLFDFYGQPSLHKYKDKNYCRDCIIVEFKSENPNPSTSEKKYEFNSFNLSWKLTKVLLPCLKCSRKRWLNIENQWKKMCITCYRSQN